MIKLFLIDFVFADLSEIKFLFSCIVNIRQHFQLQNKRLSWTAKTQNLTSIFVCFLVRI